MEFHLPFRFQAGFLLPRLLASRDATSSLIFYSLSRVRSTHRGRARAPGKKFLSRYRFFANEIFALICRDVFLCYYFTITTAMEKLRTRKVCQDDERFAKQ